MAKRRGPQEGSIYQRADGLWVGAVHLGYANGRRQRKLIYAKTRREVREKLTAAMRTHQQGLPQPGERLTVGGFLERWLLEAVRPKVRPRTFESYAGIVRRHLVPGLGRVPLAKLTPQDVQVFLNRQQAAGLSARTVQYQRAVLRAALNRALRWGLVGRNVAALVDPPRVTRPEVRPLTSEQARVFLNAVRGDRLDALYAVAFGLGLRQGEALGLRWDDVDQEAGTLTVRHALGRVPRELRVDGQGALALVEPKSASSRRTIALPAVVLAALRAHRTRQLGERLLAGSRWQEQGLVFATTLGTPLDGRAVTRRFQEQLAAAGMPRQRFHDARHSYASFLVAQGVPMRVVMDLLGHSQIALTMNLYAHVVPAQQLEAAARIDALLGG